MWDTFLVNPIFNFLLVLYRSTGSLGFSIILFTLASKFILLPLAIPSIKMTKKQRDIQPELEKLKQKYKYDKKKQAEVQMELFKQHGVNPTSGCLTMIVTLVLGIAIYNSVAMLTYGTDKPFARKDKNHVVTEQEKKENIGRLNQKVYFDQLKFSENESIKNHFGYLDLTKPDPFFILTILAVVAQFLATKMMMPIAKAESEAAKETKSKEDDIMTTMQQQNLYMMPAMFFIFGLTLPSGVMIYIFVSTVFQIGQTWYFAGLGGLVPWINWIQKRFGKKLFKV